MWWERLQHKPMVLCQMSFQGLLELRDFPSQLPLCQIGELHRILFPYDQSFQHRSARGAQDIARHRRQLDVGILQNLVNSVRSACFFLRLLRAVSGQIAQLALGAWRDEAAF